MMTSLKTPKPYGSNWLLKVMPNGGHKTGGDLSIGNWMSERRRSNR
jgi:hypothetical protein